MAWAPGAVFTVVEYLALGAAGILAKEERIELLDGEIIQMAPIGNRHLNSVDWLADLMHRALGDRAMVRVQGSIQLDDASAPQPDIAVIRRGSINDIGPVLPSDVYLLVEVADSSLEFDLGEKLARYAAAGIPEVWGCQICVPASWWSILSRKGQPTPTCASFRWAAR